MQEVEYEVPAFEQTVLERGELFIQFRQILVNELVQPFEPGCGINRFRRLLIPLMYGFLQEEECMILRKL